MTRNVRGLRDMSMIVQSCLKEHSKQGDSLAQSLLESREIFPGCGQNCCPLESRERHIVPRDSDILCCHNSVQHPEAVPPSHCPSITAGYPYRHAAPY